MASRKSDRRDEISDERSSGSRQAGSVGERPELAGSRDSGDRNGGVQSKKKKSRGIKAELEGATQNDPGLGG